MDKTIFYFQQFQFSYTNQISYQLSLSINPKQSNYLLIQYISYFFQDFFPSIFSASHLKIIQFFFFLFQANILFNFYYNFTDLSKIMKISEQFIHFIIIFMRFYIATIALTLGLISKILTQSECDIVIVGGTLASLAAAIQINNYFVCLIEPTSRLGGQFGDQGVWHIDFNWLYQNGYPDHTVAYNPKNLHPFISQVESKCKMGDCWVSRTCFLYSCIEPIIWRYLQPKISSGKLVIYYNSVVKNIQKQGNLIKSTTIIQRNQKEVDCRSADQIIEDWYSYGDNKYYQKVQKTIIVRHFLIEASQYGDILALAQTDYLQGTINSQKCGQSIVFGVHQIFQSSNHKLIQKNLSQFHINSSDDFSLAGYTVDQVWRYRRLLGKGLNPKQGEITLQNWNGPGNDYRDGYLFLSKKQLNLSDWKGGINYTTIKQAEARAKRYHEWFKNQSQLPIILTGKYFNTCTGLSRLPYVRDGRRSVGYKNYTMMPQDVTGKFIPLTKLTANVPSDRIGLGFYNMDIHSIKGCQYDPFNQKEPLPFFLPARAFTNNKIINLIPAGRAMAQQFYTSSATRTHTTQFASGVASMMMATYMISAKINSTWKLIDCMPCVADLQDYVRRVMPLQWTIDNKTYPSFLKQQLE